jgi:hypothetical protein
MGKGSDFGSGKIVSDKGKKYFYLHSANCTHAEWPANGRARLNEVRVQ